MKRFGRPKAEAENETQGIMAFTFLDLVGVIEEGGDKDRSRSGSQKDKRTYNTRDSLVVTDPTTSLAVSSLSRGERTGSRVLYCLWSYVIAEGEDGGY